MKNHFAYDLIQAVKTFRTCPPPEQRRGKNWARHLETCQFCRNEENQVWEGFTDELKPFLTAPLLMPAPVPGDIRQIDPRKGRWVNGEYMNPPLVLVLDIDETRRMARCAMICHEIDAAAPGDLILSEETTDFLDLAVETWNRLTVKTEDLGARVGGVSEACLDDIDVYAKDSTVAPSWALVPLSVKDADDPRLAIRKLEKITAAVFSLTPLDTLASQAASLVDQFRKLLPGLDDLLKGRSLTEAALAFAFPGDRRPAFAHGDRELTPVDFRTLILKHDSLVNYYPSAGVVETDETIKGRRTLSGKGTPFEGAGLFTFMACLALPSGELFPADNAVMEKDGFFTAEFDVSQIQDHQSARPVFCAIYQADGHA